MDISKLEKEYEKSLCDKQEFADWALKNVPLMIEEIKILNKMSDILIDDIVYIFNGDK